MNIAIVGMGISGLLTSLHLLLNNHVDTVTIYEKKYKEFLPRKHCTGLVSKETLVRIPYADKFIKNSYSYVEISTVEGLDVVLIFNKGSIYRIDRVSHEKFVVDIISDKGVTVKYGENVVGVEKFGDRYRVLGKDIHNELFDVVVISEGYPPRISKSIGLEAVYKPLKGIQADVELSKKLKYEQIETLCVYLGVDSDGFAWFVPGSDRRAVVGVAVKNTPSSYLKLAIKLFEKKLGLDVEEIVDIYGGVVLRGYPKKVVVERVLGIGDAVAMVKSLSGGGLYAVSIASRIYGENIHRLGIAEKEVELLIRELKNQYMLFKLVSRTLRIRSGYQKKRKIVLDIDESRLYDNHVEVLIEFLKKPHILLKFFV
jgi:flavin-dependent dehydrogenase